MAAVVVLLIGLQKAVLQSLAVLPVLVTKSVLPLAIISSIAVVRYVQPPQVDNSCRYHSNNMPSEGMLPFLQTFSCNLNNQCRSNSTRSAKEIEASERVKRLENSLQPLLGNATAAQQFSKLPAAVTAINKVADAAANNGLADFVSSLDITVASLFHNASLVRRFLSEEARVLTPEAADALLAAKLNLTELLARIGGQGFGDVACDPVLLGKYLLLDYSGKRNASVMQQISSAVCRLNASISDFLFASFDIGKALQLFQNTLAVSNNYNASLAFADARTLVQMLPRMRSLQQLGPGLSQWAASVLGLVEQVVMSPSIMSDIGFIGSSLQSAVQLLGSTAGAEVERILAAAQRSMQFVMKLQHFTMNATLKQLLPQPLLQSLANSSSMSMAQIGNARITLPALLHMAGAGALNTDATFRQLCNGGLDLKQLVSPADVGMRVQQFVCDGQNNSAMRVAESVNFAALTIRFIESGPAVNLTQLIMDASSLLMAAQTGSGPAILQEAQSLLNGFGAASATNSTTGMLAAISPVVNSLRKILPAQLNLSVVCSLLSAETSANSSTWPEEYSRFLLSDSEITAWINTSRAIFPNDTVHMSLFSFASSAARFAYENELINSQQLQMQLCSSSWLQLVADSSTRKLLAGPQAAVALRHFCSNAAVFVKVAEYFRQQQRNLLVREQQLMAYDKLRVSEASATGQQWMMQWLTGCPSCMQHLSAYHASSTNQIMLQTAGCGARITEMEAHSLQPTYNAMVANMVQQSVGYYTANSFVLNSEAISRMLASPQIGEVVQHLLQLALDMGRSPPMRMVAADSPAPLCNGTNFVQLMPDLANYSSAHSLSNSLCTLASSYPMLLLDTDVRMLAAVMQAAQSAVRNYAQTAGSLAKWTNRLTYETWVNNLLPMMTVAPAFRLDFNAFILQAISPMYNLLHEEMTNNRTDMAMRQLLMDANFALNLQSASTKVAAAYVLRLNSTRDFVRAAVDTPQIQELMASAPAAMETLILTVLRTSTLTVAVPPGNVTLCVNYTLSDIIAGVGSHSSVRRLSDALCSALAASAELQMQAMQLLQPILPFFDPTQRQQLTMRKYNFSDDAATTAQLQMAITQLAGVAINDLLPSGINFTSIGAAVVASYSNMTQLLQMQSESALMQLQNDASLGTTVRTMLQASTQLVSQFTGLLQATNYSISGMVSGTELQKLLNLMNQVPTLLPTLTNTAIAMQTDAQLQSDWLALTNPMLLCSDAALFGRLMRVPPRLGVTPAALQMQVCSVLTLNGTVLLTQLFQRMPALMTLATQVSCLTTACPSSSVNITSLSQLLNSYNQLAIQLQQLTSSADLSGVRTEIFNATYLQMLLGPELMQLASIANSTADPASLQQQLSLIWPLLDQLIPLLNSTLLQTAEMQQLLLWQQAVMDILHLGPQQLQLSLNSTADGQRLWHVMTQLPHLLVAVSYTAQTQPTKLSLLSSSLTSALTAQPMPIGVNFTNLPASTLQQQLCSLKLSDFLVVPPTLSLDLNAFQSSLCQLNLTDVVLPASAQAALGVTVAGTVDADQLRQLLNLTASSNWAMLLGQWLPFAQTWASGAAAAVAAAPGGFDISSIANNAAYQSLELTLLLLPPSLQQQVKMSLSVQEFLLDYGVAALEGAASGNWTLADLLHRTPQMQKLMQLLTDRTSDILLIAAANQRQLQTLLVLNDTQKSLAALCFGSNSTVMTAMGLPTVNFTSPRGACASCVIAQFCAIDIMALMAEANGIGMSVVNSAQRTNVSVAQVAAKNNRLQQLITELTVNSTLQMAPQNWTALAEMLQMDLSNNTAQTLSDLLLTVYFSVQDPSLKATLATTLAGIATEWVPRLEAAIESRSIHSLLNGVPLLESLLNLTADGNNVAKVLLEAVVTDSSKVVQLITNPQAAAAGLSQMCNGSLQLHQLLSISNRTDTRSIQRSVCKLLQDTANQNALSMRLLQLLGQYFWSGPEMSVSNHTDASLPSVNASVLQLQSLFTNLVKLVNLDSSTVTPQIDLNAYMTLLQGQQHLANFTSPQTLTWYYSMLMQLLNTYTQPAVSAQLTDIMAGTVRLTQALSNYAAGAVSESGSMELTNLVANVSAAELLLQQLLRPHNLSSLRVHSGRLPELIAMVTANASSICYIDLNRYFQLQATLNGSALQMSLCNLAADFATGIAGNMNAMRVLQAAAGFATPNQTASFNELWQAYMSLMSLATRLSPGFNFTYRGLPVQQLFQLTDAPSIDKLLFAGAATVSGQVELILGIASSAAMSLDASLPKDPMLATALRITQAVMASAEPVLRSAVGSGFKINLAGVFANSSAWAALLNSSTISGVELSSLMNFSVSVPQLISVATNPSAVCNTSNGMAQYLNLPANSAAASVLNLALCQPALQQQFLMEFMRLIGVERVTMAAAPSNSSASLLQLVQQLQQVITQGRNLLLSQLGPSTGLQLIDSLLQMFGNSSMIGQLAAVAQQQLAASLAGFNQWLTYTPLIQSATMIIAPQIHLSNTDFAMLLAITGRVQESAAVLQSLQQLLAGKATADQFTRSLSMAASGIGGMNKSVMMYMLLGTARSSAARTVQLCASLGTVLTNATDAAAVNGSVCQVTADRWGFGGVSDGGLMQLRAFYGFNASSSPVQLQWSDLSSTLNSSLSLAQSLTTGITLPDTANLTRLLQQVSAQPITMSLLQSVAAGLDNTSRSVVSTGMQAALTLTAMLGADLANLTAVLGNAAVMQQMIAITNNQYFTTEVDLMTIDPNYMQLPAANVTAALCDATQFNQRFPTVRNTMAMRAMPSVGYNWTIAYAYAAPVMVQQMQVSLCQGAGKQLLMLQFWQRYFQMGHMVQAVNSYNNMTMMHMMQQFIAGNDSVFRLAERVMHPQMMALINAPVQAILGQLNAATTINSTSDVFSQICPQIEQTIASQPMALWTTANGTAVTIQQLLNASMQHSDVLGAAVCDMIQAELPSSVDRMLQLMAAASSASQQFKCDAAAPAFANLSSAVAPCLAQINMFYPKLMQKFGNYSNVMQLVTKMNELQTIIGPEATTTINQIILTFANSLRGQMTLQTLLMNSTLTVDTVAQLLNVGKDTANAVLQATLTVNMTLANNLTDLQLQDHICSASKMQKLFQFPPALAIDMSAVSTQLCRQLNQSELDKRRILLSLRTAVSPDLSSIDLTSWLQAVTDFNFLLTELQRVQELAQIARGFDLRRLPEYERIIGDLLRSFPGEKFQRVGFALVKDLRRVTNDAFWTALMDDLDMLIGSMRMFELLKPLFPIKLQVKDFVEDVAKVRTFLVEQGIPMELTYVILDSYLSTQQLFNFSLKLNLPVALCDQEKLQELLDFSNSTYNTSDLVAQMCQNATLRDIENITETILAMGNFGQFLTRQFASGIAEKLLADSNVTVQEVKDLVTLVNSVGAPLQNAVNELASIAANISVDSDGGIGSQSSLSSLSEGVCGRSDSFAFTTVYTVPVSASATSSSSSSSSSSTARRRRKRSTAGTSASEKASYDLGVLARKPFCLSMYELSQASNAGRVAWTYVKPLIRGRIIVTPDTSLTRRLMTRVQSQLTQVSSLQQLSSSLAGLLPVISNSSSSNSSNSLATMLRNPLVNNAVSSLFGSGVNLDSLLSLMTSVGGSSSSSSNAFGQQQVMQLLSNITECVETERLDFASSDAVFSELSNSALMENRLLAAVSFMNLPTTSSTRRRRATANGTSAASGLPQHVKYTIRMPHGSLYKTDQLTQYPEINIKRDDFVFDLAYQRGFVQVQEAIDTVITELHTGKKLPAIRTQQMPASCVQMDTMLMNFGFSGLPLCAVFMWIAPMAIAVTQLMRDREQRLEVPLFLMGLRPLVQFLQWLIIHMVEYLIISAVFTIIVHFFNLLSATDPTIIFALLCLQSFSALSFGFMVASAFDTASSAAAVSVMLYLILFVPYIMLGFMPYANVHAVRALHIFCPTAFSLAMRGIVLLELTRDTVSWNDLQLEAYGVPVYWSFIALALDTVVCFAVGWYVRNVRPGQNGIPQGWLFFLTPRYWGCDSSSSSSGDAEASFGNAKVTVVELRNVSKKYGDKLAVNDVSLSLMADETTVLLGPNGAGKSTTIGMITGLLASDSGTVLVKGLDVSKHFYKLRSNIGFCPQHDVCYQDLSVQSNVDYFGGVKGCPKQERKQLLHSLGLHKLRRVKAGDLSGGQRRRLSIGLAFLGQPSLVVLDEPTASVDPDARRAIWELVKSYKCSTLICTHDMQEAEALGDRVVVMVDGSVAANQTFSELSSNCKYTVTADSPAPAELANSLRAGDFEVTQVACNTNAGKVSAEARHSGRNMERVTEFLHMNRQLVSRFTLACSTVADFFNRVIDSNAGQQEQQQQQQEYTMMSGTPSAMNSFAALLIKRMHHTRRSLLTYIGMVLLPSLFVLLAMGSSLLRPMPGAASDPILLTPTNYGPQAVSFLHQAEDYPASMAAAVRNSLAAAPGLGTACMSGMQQLLHYSARCGTAAGSWQAPNVSAADAALYMSSSNCSCSATGHYSCADKYSVGHPPAVLNSPSGDIIHEYSASTVDDLNDFLLRSSANFSIGNERVSPVAPAMNQRWGGLQLAANQSTIWFDNRGYHTLPAYLNAFANTMLRAYVAENSSVEMAAAYGISAYNHPLPMQRSQLSSEIFNTAIMDGGLAMCIVFALCFVPASLAAVVAEERVTQQPRQMRLYGMSNLVYWSASFMWDLLVYLLPALITIGIMAAFQIDLYTARINLPAIAMLLVLFGAASIPLAYLFSRVVRTSASAFIICFFMLFLVGILMLFVIVLIRSYLTFAARDTVVEVLTYLFMVMPSFTLGHGIFRIMENQWRATVLMGYGADTYVSPFTMQQVGIHAIALGAACVVYWLLNILCERRCSTSRKLTTSTLADSSSDLGVQEEIDRVSSGASGNDPIRMLNLSKSFKAAGGFTVKALDRLSLSVPRATCLGLLGPNGSGKTTVFNILTQHIADYEGQCSTELLGYCPQYEPLDWALSVEETLRFYARLRGISSSMATRQVQQLTAALCLQPGKVVRHLSGGQRRKLSVAIAFIGAPRSILLDEPSAGLDTSSRYNLNQLVAMAKQQGASVLFTSHCMDEVQQVCDRLAFLIGGQLKAIGNLQQLQDHLGGDYSLTVRCRYQHMESLSKSIDASFNGAKCRFKTAGVLEYSIPVSVPSHEIFNRMEDISETLNVDYTVRQTTLDQVFLELCSLQGDSWRSSGSNGSSSGDSSYGSVSMMKGTSTVDTLSRHDLTTFQKSSDRANAYVRKDFDEFA